ncbi:MAG: redoxin [Robiginitomaculum sp.]|nr:MAG: redoxin [Robiginitomaculum sp.]
MQKLSKIALYLLLAIGLAGILFVTAKSLINPNGKQARNEQNDKSSQPVLGQLVTLKPRPSRPSAIFLGQDGTEFILEQFEGKVVLLNIWATWCEPCVKEMPSLDALQAQLGGENFVVVAISEDRSAEEALEFYEKNAIQNLTFYRDKDFGLVRELYVKDYPTGLPISVLYDRQGRELARLSGGFDWISEAAITRIEQAISVGAGLAE